MPDIKPTQQTAGSGIDELQQMFVEDAPQQVNELNNAET